MEIYNTLTRSLEPLATENNKVRIYCCGPTVYAMPHVGNFRTFFFGDLLKRWLQFVGFDVTFVENITDIDDKTIRDSKKENLPFSEFTEKYTKEFFRGCNWLNIELADVHPKATDHIPEMIQLVEKLVSKGLAYEKEGSVYYSIDKFKDYGKLARLKRENLVIGKSVDVDEYDKDNPADFVLWKAAKQEEIERKIYWDSPWGPGRPGWHLECSILSTKYLGEPFELHLGGVDLIFPHHTNEIAQSEGARDSKKPFVKQWMHGEHLIVDGKKMSKSLGNYFTLDDLQKQFDSTTIRMFFLNAHYRDVLNFTIEAVKQVDSQRLRIKTTLDDLQSEISKNNQISTTVFTKKDTQLYKNLSSYKEKIIQDMNKDLGTPAAMKSLNNIVRSINSYLQENNPNKNLSTLKYSKSILDQFLDLFGLFPEYQTTSPKDDELTQSLIQDLITLRNNFREEKQWVISDQIRDLLKKNGIELKDLKDGTRWRKISE